MSLRRLALFLPEYWHILMPSGEGGIHPILGWNGRVRLKWAHGLKVAGWSKDARIEARAARDLLRSVLGPDDDFAREAADLLKELDEAE